MSDAIQIVTVVDHSMLRMTGIPREPYVRSRVISTLPAQQNERGGSAENAARPDASELDN